jgi:ATP-dependent DNA ligase
MTCSGFGCAGIMSKRLGSPYRSGRSKHWVKVGTSREARSRRILEPLIVAERITENDVSRLPHRVEDRELRIVY